MKVVVKGPLSPQSGYGNDLIGIVQALLRMGADVSLVPTHVEPPLPPEIARLLTKPVVAPFDLGINHWDPSTIEATAPMRRSCKVLVGWTMWEFASAPGYPKGALSICGNRSSLHRRTTDFDLILGYDENSVEALRPFVRKSLPLAILQGGYESERWRPQQRDWFSERFGFCMHGALHARKDPFAAVQAFQQAQNLRPDDFGRHATLSLHTVTPGLHPAMAEHNSKMRIFYEVWSEEVLTQFYKANHVLVAPSRGEGKHMPSLEMLSTAGAAICSDFGGFQQWMTDDIAYPLRGTLGTRDAVHTNCLEFRPDLEHLTELMLHTYLNRGEVRDKAQRASQIIPLRCDWSVVMDHFWDRVRAFVPGKGEELYNEVAQLKMEQRQQEERVGSGVGGLLSGFGI